MDTQESSYKYLAIKDALTQEIDDGAYPHMTKLPGENKLAETYGASVLTVRRALADMVHEGKVKRMQGKGTFVIKDGSEGSNGTNGFTNGIKAVSLIIPSYDESDTTIVRIIRGAQSYLTGVGYSLVVDCSHVNYIEEAEILSRYQSDVLGGIILFSADPTANKRKILDLTKRNIPHVLLDRSMDIFSCSFVSSYNTDGGFKITEHYIQNGHQRIAFIFTDLNLDTESSRLDGYRTAHEIYNTPYDSRLIYDWSLCEPETLRTFVQEYEPTALLCVNDKTALTAMSHLQGMGYRIPDDFSVSGFDDLDMIKHLSPALTTVAQDFDSMGREAARLLIGQINGTIGSTKLYLPMELIIRGSTGCIGGIRDV